MEKHPEPIHFKPLNEGLGFHPFSDGLPYSPSTPNRKFSQGTGAVAAGRPTFATQEPQIQWPARETQQRPAQIQPAPILEPALPMNEFDSGYLLRRIFAYLVDSAINLSLCCGALAWVFWKQNIQPQMFLAPEMLLALFLFTVFFSWALVTAQEIALGTSAGKRFFGLSVNGSPTLLLMRSVFFLLGGFFCGLGLIWALFDGDRRCWHDLATGIQPIRNS